MFRYNNREELRGKVQFIVMEEQFPKEEVYLKKIKGQINWEHKILQSLLLLDQAMISEIFFSQPPMAHTAEESNVGKFTPT